MFLVPSTVTVIGIFCGFLSLMSSMKGNFAQATVYIAIAFVLDGLDGRIARRLNATSPFGREFDSLSDVVAFGVAPAVLVYTWGFNRIADEFGILIAFVYLVCGATRLARFNVDTEARKHFQGLPIPGAAFGLACIVYVFPDPIVSNYAVSLVVAYTLTLAVLMVSSIPFYSLKNIRLTDGNPRLNLLIVATAVALAWYNSKLIISLGTVAYLIGGPGYLYWRKTRKNATEA
jgi:CDP-diacylglycerol--serine O-phosphatidyltransferase